MCETAAAKPTNLMTDDAPAKRQVCGYRDVMGIISPLEKDAHWFIIMDITYSYQLSSAI